MLPDVQALIDLQQADREISRLKDEIATLPKRVAAIEEKLAGTKAQLAKAKDAIKADEQARRKHEGAIQELQQKISKYRDQSLDVKTNEQYKALLSEIQFAERDIRAHEDKILELMVNAESRDKDVKAAEAELKAEAAEIEKEKADAHERTAQDEKELAEWNAKRSTARTAVNPDLLRHYDRVSKYRGTGLSEVLDQKCTACQVMLRPQTFNEVRTGTQTVICDSCQRILYYDTSHEKPVETVSATRRRRAHPKFDASQAWYYHPEYGEHGEVFLVFVNNGGEAMRRIFDAHTGREFGDPHLRPGEYRLAFPEDLQNTIRLNGHWEPAEIEEWGAELPTNTIDVLQRDLDMARAEARSSHHPQEAAHSGHPAAS